MSEIKLTADSGGGTTSIKAPSTTTSNADVVLKLPVADGSSGQVLKTDGSGQLSFTSNAGTTINNNADNKVITGSGTANTLEAESGLTYNGQKLVINTVTSENSAIKLFNTTSSSQVYHVNGEGNSFIGHTYPRSDANLDLGFHSGYRWRDVVLSGGIRFGSANSSDYLDDYEEGTWTPEFLNVNTPSYNSRSGRYTKIGRFVYLTGKLNVHSGLDTSDGSAVAIGGLPFTGNNDHNSCLFAFGRYTSLLPDSTLSQNTNFRFNGTNVMLHRGSNYDINYTLLNSSGILEFALSYQQ